MVPSYKDNAWQAGISTKGNIIQIRVQEGEEFRDYWVPNNPANADYQQYLEWLAEGNTPQILG
jgi:hypothetical protein